MRLLLPLLLLFAALPARAQLNNWDPSWYVTDSTLVFHDDLDYYLNAYSKNEIKEMRKEVNIWRMNFDKLSVCAHGLHDFEPAYGHCPSKEIYPFLQPWLSQVSSRRESEQFLKFASAVFEKTAPEAAER